MFRKLLLSAFLLVTTQTAIANDSKIHILNDDAGFWDIATVEIQRTAIEEINTQMSGFSFAGDCKPAIQPNTGLTDGSGLLDGVDLDVIVNLGKKAWEFINNNKAVVNATSTSANALPASVDCWNDLTNWQKPRSETYSVIYKNGFGLQVVELEFKLIYAYGGRYKDKGQYLSAATIQYSKLNVRWGFNLDAKVDVPMVLNLGSKEDPVAGLQLNINWKVTGLNHLEQTAGFFVYGDGRPTDAL